MRVYRIKLSSPDKVVEIHQRYPDGRMQRVTTKLRSIELEILDTCFTEIAVHAKNVHDYLTCIKIAQQMQGLTDNVTSINFKKQDIENFLTGFTATAGKRQLNWARAVDFWDQVSGPEEVELEDKKEV